MSDGIDYWYVHTRASVLVSVFAYLLYECVYQQTLAREGAWDVLAWARARGKVRAKVPTLALMTPNNNGSGNGSGNNKRPQFEL